jgi:hypothetical protein
VSLRTLWLQLTAGTRSRCFVRSCRILPLCCPHSRSRLPCPLKREFLDARGKLTPSAIKLAKTVLSDDRDNLSLWDGYARLERQRGKIQAARQVYVTALQAAGQRERTADAKMEENTLWASWAEMEFSEGEEERCLEVLVMAAGSGLSVSCAEAGHVPSRPSAVALLKAKQVSIKTPSKLTPSTTPQHLIQRHSPSQRCTRPSRNPSKRRATACYPS